MNKKINELNKKIAKTEGSGITLTNNEIEDIINLIMPLENRGMLLQGSTEEIVKQKGGFLGNALVPLIKGVKSFNKKCARTIS